MTTTSPPGPQDTHSPGPSQPWMRLLAAGRRRLQPRLSHWVVAFPFALFNWAGMAAAPLP